MFPRDAYNCLISFFQGECSLFNAINAAAKLLAFFTEGGDHDHEPQPVGDKGDCPDCKTDEGCIEALEKLKDECDKGDGVQASHLPAWVVPLVLSLFDRLLSIWKEKKE